MVKSICKEKLSGLYAFIFLKQDAGQRSIVKAAHKCFEIVTKFMCFGMRVINQNSVLEEC